MTRWKYFNQGNVALTLIFLLFVGVGLLCADTEPIDPEPGPEPGPPPLGYCGCPYPGTPSCQLEHNYQLLKYYHQMMRAMRGHSVEVATGKFRPHVQDLYVRGRGMDVDVVRTYGGRYLTYLGQWWDLNWFKRIVLQKNPFPLSYPWILLDGAYYYDGSGRIEKFGSPSGTVANGMWQLAEEGRPVKLMSYKEFPNGTPLESPDKFIMRQSDGALLTFEEIDGSNALVGGTMTTTYWLTSVKDRGERSKHGKPPSGGD
ncbi:MAG: hypothetical protein ABIK28_17815 [Planctomycetota bacterium]